MKAALASCSHDLTFIWKDAVGARRSCCCIKTTGERYDALSHRLRALHPYEVPEMVVFSIAGGHEPYLAWLAASVG